MILTLVVANLTLTSAMFGVIWVIQLVHYPMLGGLNESKFSYWHQFHSRRITYLVAPLMVGELALSASFAWVSPTPGSFLVFGFTLGVWLSTFYWSVTLHELLARVDSRSNAQRNELIKKLVKTNWPRTILYTAKVISLIWIFA